MTFKFTNETLSVQLTEKLENQIINGDLLPGQRLVADEIASINGISRIPVRESLRYLEAKGWVEIRPRYGTYVIQRSIVEFEQIFAVRKLLECEAARLASLNATPIQIEKIVAKAREFSKASTTTPKKLPTLNREFHQLIAYASGNLVLQKYLEQISQRVKWYFSAVVSERSRESAMEHLKLAELIAQKKSSQAHKAMALHIESTHDAVKRSISLSIKSDKS